MLTDKSVEQDKAAGQVKKRIAECTNRVQGMSHEISSLNNEIAERSTTIREKVIDRSLSNLVQWLSPIIQNDRINDLELKNQELEKFRYVLNYKIDELTRLIRPREEEIERMKDQLLQVTALISHLFFAMIQ